MLTYSKKRNSAKICALFAFTFILLLSGCGDDNVGPVSMRKVRFELFTTEDFSQETNTITFNPVISIGKKVLWDSTFNPILIKQIPNEANKIVFEKTVAADLNAELKVGFKYSIENVGLSWYYDKVLPGEESKTVTYNFQ